MSNEEQTISPEEQPVVVYCWNSIHPYELLNRCEAKKDPETGELLFGLYSTSETPLPPKEGYAVCRDLHANKWIYLPDHRGKVYWTKEMSWKDQGLPILYPGEIPEGASLTPPKKPADVFRAELRRAIRDHKRMMRNVGIVVNGVRYDSDYNAEIAYLSFSLNTKTNTSYTKRWKASTDQWVTMNRELCLQLIEELNNYLDRLYNWQERKEIELASTPDDLLSYFKVE